MDTISSTRRRAASLLGAVKRMFFARKPAASDAVAEPQPVRISIAPAVGHGKGMPTAIRPANRYEVLCTRDLP